MALTDRQNIAISLRSIQVPKSFVHTPADGKPAEPDTAFEFTADASTDLLSSAAHGLVADDPVRFTSTTTLPAGLSAGTTYYVIASGLTVDVFKVSATVGGSAVNITDAGTGPHSWRHYLTTEELAELATFKAFVTSGAGMLPAPPVLRGSIAMVARFATYHQSAAYRTWWHDNEETRDAQYRYRKAEVLAGSIDTVPISADDTGAGDDPPISPIAHGDPP